MAIRKKTRKISWSLTIDELLNIYDSLNDNWRAGNGKAHWQFVTLRKKLEKRLLNGTREWERFRAIVDSQYSE